MNGANQNQPLIIGHRGAAGEAPENTLVSFALAVEQGADAVELDVHLSVDGELVVCHDATVDRTTNGHGAIKDMTAEDLKRLDAGSWFHEQFAGERLPLLEEVFQAVPDRVMVNVEIKCPYSALLQDRLFGLLSVRRRWESVVVSSFDHKILQRLKEVEPALRVGLLYTANFVSHSQVAEISGMDVYSLHPYHALIGAEDAADAALNGLKVYPYTANAPGDLLRLVEAGVSGIITDYPARLRALLDSGVSSI